MDSRLGKLTKLTNEFSYRHFLITLLQRKNTLKQSKHISLKLFSLATESCNPHFRIGVPLKRQLVNKLKNSNSTKAMEIHSSEGDPELAV